MEPRSVLASLSDFRNNRLAPDSPADNVSLFSERRIILRKILFYDPDHCRVCDVTRRIATRWHQKPRFSPTKLFRSTLRPEKRCANSNALLNRRSIKRLLALAYRNRHGLNLVSAGESRF